jgi:hypothetical protein
MYLGKKTETEINKDTRTRKTIAQGQVSNDIEREREGEKRYRERDTETQSQRPQMAEAQQPEYSI